MEPTQGKPVRRRRRWLIVAVLLVVVSTVLGWFWPRGDTRFVGRWAYSIDGGRSTLFDYRLNVNGTGSFTDRVSRVFFSWRVKNGELIWGNEGEGPVGRPLHSVALFALKQTGQTVLLRQHRCRIVSIGEDVLQIEQDGGPHSRAPMVTLTRILE